MTNPEQIAVCYLGRLAYEPTRRLQKEIQQSLIAAKQEANAEEVPPHVLLLLEHPPVYTVGKSGDLDHLLASEQTLEALDADVHRIGRGGDVTYHGPGQLVGYPLLDLDRFFTDLGRYLRTLEEVIIRSCAHFGVTGRRVNGRTGVWVGPDDRGLERKICAMGVRCSRWVTMHGFAFNVTTDLNHFDHIIPCGIDDREVTSLNAEIDQSVTVDAVRPPLVHHFAELFDAEARVRSGSEARAFLHEIAGINVVTA